MLSVVVWTGRADVQNTGEIKKQSLKVVDAKFAQDNEDPTQKNVMNSRITKIFTSRVCWRLFPKAFSSGPSYVIYHSDSNTHALVDHDRARLRLTLSWSITAPLNILLYEIWVWKFASFWQMSSLSLVFSYLHLLIFFYLQTFSDFHSTCPHWLCDQNPCWNRRQDRAGWLLNSISFFFSCGASFSVLLFCCIVCLLLTFVKQREASKQSHDSKCCQNVQTFLFHSSK